MALHSGEPAYESLPKYFEERLVPSAGLKAARARGRKGGRPRKLKAKEIKAFNAFVLFPSDRAR